MCVCAKVDGKIRGRKILLDVRVSRIVPKSCN